MNTFIVCMVIALSALAYAEPPVGYSYNRPSGGGHSFSGGSSFSGGHSFGGSSFGGSSFGSSGHGGGGSGGGYIAVSHGHQTSEGQHVDGALLEQIRQILLKEELNSQSHHGGGGHISAPSSSYGVPSPVYGVPHHHTRVVGIDLEGVRQAIQVAQYSQTSHQSFGGYPSGPSSSYHAPSSSYGAPSIPSGSYGAPF